MPDPEFKASAVRDAAPPHGAPGPEARQAVADLYDQLALSLTALRQKAPAVEQWHWDGYLAPRRTTLLVGQWKAGKTTLLSVLLSKLSEGGEVAGRRVTPASVLVVSEEDAEQWKTRTAGLAIGERVRFMCRPPFHLDRRMGWYALADLLEEAVRRRGVQIVVLDPIARFLPPDAEHSAPAMARALDRLEEIVRRGAALLLVHHPQKGRRAGQTSRGTGALPAAVDILLELSCVTSDPTDRRRRLRGHSRSDRTPRDEVIEWTASGADFRACGLYVNPALQRDLPQLVAILAQAKAPLEFEEILARWPTAAAPMPAKTLRRRLKEAVATGVLNAHGAGRFGSPYQYQLARST